jgi:hypothetical protein
VSPAQFLATCRGSTSGAWAGSRRGCPNERHVRTFGHWSFPSNVFFVVINVRSLFGICISPAVLETRSHGPWAIKGNKPAEDTEHKGTYNACI